ncbi:glycerophosphodiester phosphodiesterase family protein [Maribacter algicola]|uniref:Glycerophosphodiester phosphodiesterase family protein n=1 Tax=Meishania litoralis TaxID=3434685 RepID=A0ACC7LFX4_9FLAO
MKKYILLSVLLFLSFLSCKHSVKEQPKSNINVPKLAVNKVVQTIDYKSKNNILVCAHRSYHKNAPENSLQSIKNAIILGIDLVELDVRTTKDSVLVLMHDDSIGRVSTGKGKLNDFTFKELQNFSLKIEDSVTPYKIPKLSDALKTAKGKVIPNLDIKDLDFKALYALLCE